MKIIKYKKNQFNHSRQLGAFTVEYAYVISIMVLMVVGVSGVMKTPLANFMDCAAEKIAEYIIGDSSAGCGSANEAVVSASPIDITAGNAQKNSISNSSPKSLVSRRADESESSNVSSSLSEKGARSFKSPAIIVSQDQKAAQLECEQGLALAEGGDNVQGAFVADLEHCDSELIK